MRAATALGLVLVCGVNAGCEPRTRARSAPETVLTTVTVAPPGDGSVPSPGAPAPVTEAPPAPPAPVPAGDLTARVPAGSAIAFAPVGRPGEMTVAGTWTTGVAWSSIKVPLAVAALRSGPSGSARAALTASDNDAAQALWDSLGGGSAAADAVTRVLRDGGDQVSTVPSTRLRAGFTVFGQTTWTLRDQVGFATRLPCVDGAGPVVDLMGQVIESQRWGLGRIPGARFKGGWGPSTSGGYLVRQFGLVPGAGGDVAVAVAVEGGSFEQGTAALDSLVEAAGPTLAGAPGGRC